MSSKSLRFMQRQTAHGTFKSTTYLGTMSGVQGGVLVLRWQPGLIREVNDLADAVCEEVAREWRLPIYISIFVEAWVQVRIRSVLA